jgi:hypothetical protein
MLRRGGSAAAEPVAEPLNGLLEELVTGGEGEPDEALARVAERGPRDDRDVSPLEALGGEGDVVLAGPATSTKA